MERLCGFLTRARDISQALAAGCADLLLPPSQAGYVYLNGCTGAFQEESDCFRQDRRNHFDTQTSARQNMERVRANPNTNVQNISFSSFKYPISSVLQWHSPGLSAGCRYTAVLPPHCCAAGAAEQARYYSRCSCKSPWRRTCESCGC